MAPLHPDVQWNHEASMRSHAGLLPLYSDRDTQGLTSHVTLCPVCFPDAIKDVEQKKNKKKSARVQSRSLSQQARFDVRVCRSVTHRESDEPPGLQSGPHERGDRKGTIALLLNSQPLECTEGSERVRPQLLELSRCYGTSSPPTFYFQLLRLWAGMRCWHQFISPTNEAVKRLRSQIVTRGLLNSWMNSEALKSSVSDLLFLLDAVGLNSVQSEKKRFLCPITGNKSTLPMLSHPVTYHLSVVLSALQEFLCKVI